ncbi:MULTISPECIES: right-handed parallel beta-helix repeat-containing protein [Bradyrhizobium]|uniref:Right-handed parallel beta-helix repeat-containing protein n=1 Tax=Bradyrhizobium ottawaense TaxID=931866 RepID=A0A2U8PAU6_9BRAD|nr:MULTISPECIES: right-handed parallel beta-helix repeat-containing protein [Bradyrhizobium]AWL94895.1 right-handed parallel beta-helix repeat-containing protein [Bradyrhizobium ottawaense]MBR1324469.1 right-handed parallel beta-helix repeat-containing protein [Bradyrhizobium ottawaense]MBR1332635.1 right-handed parallel beta-helix repeat-containing protein [Bradyrhizobium ottawaense]MDA9413483.1 membrane protein [Bradyrhizobium sp. CCBAU 25360]MDA9450531.1 membrane protein [Bradyrhizobium sp.
MRRIALWALLAGLVLPFAVSQPAHAQATRTWVSGVGDDVNPCSRTAPCKTFAGAISKTAAGGEINCLDSAGFGTVTITKAMTIYCEGVVGSILGSGTNGVNINAAATDHIVLRGLDIEGAGTGVKGVNILQAASVVIEHCFIRDFNGASGTGIFSNPVNFNSMLMIRDSVISHNGTAAAGAGISINTNGGSTRVLINNTAIHNNFVGLNVQGSSNVQVNNSNISENLSTGFALSGTAGARIGRSVIVNNLGAATTGNVLSYLDNQINGNAPDTTPATAGGYH